MATAEDSSWPPKYVSVCRTGISPSYDGVSCHRNHNRLSERYKDQDCMCSRAYDRWLATFKHKRNYGYKR